MPLQVVASFCDSQTPNLKPATRMDTCGVQVLCRSVGLEREQVAVKLPSRGLCSEGAAPGSEDTPVCENIAPFMPAFALQS